MAVGEPIHPYEHELRLSAVSGKLVGASASGGPAVFGDEAWGDERIVRADFLAGVLTELSGVTAVVLRGARITGTLDLEARSVCCPLVLDCCRLEGPVNLKDATASIIRLHMCDVHALVADGLSARQLSLDKCHLHSVSLVGARVDAVMSMRDVEVKPPDAPPSLRASALSPGDADAHNAQRAGRIAVNADRLVAGAVAFDRCETSAEVRLVGAHVAKISFSGAQLTVNEGPALSAEGIQVAEDMLFWRDPHDASVPFRARGQVRLTGARVRTLSMNASELAACKPKEPALSADGITVQVGLHMDERVAARGVSLVGGDVHVLSLVDAQLRPADGVALSADRLTVSGGMFCKGLDAQGQLSMLDAQIEGVIDLCDARLDHGHRRTLCADGLRLDGSLRAHGCKIIGTMMLRGAQVSGVINLEQARLRNPGKDALRCEQLVAGGVTAEKCTIVGRTKFSGAKIKGRLRLQKSTLRNPMNTALEADELTVEDEFQCDGATFDGSVLLRGASVSMASFTKAHFRDVPCTGRDAHVALRADGMTVRRDVFFDRAKTEGTIALVGAHIAVLSLKHATFRARVHGAIALDAGEMTVDRGIYGEGLRTHGKLVLNGCDIGGPLDLRTTALRCADGASATHSDNTPMPALELREASIGGVLSLRLTEPACGPIDLRDAKLGQLDIRPDNNAPTDAQARPPDHQDTLWPRCWLTDCTYETLHTGNDSAQDAASEDRTQRIAWLAQDRDYAPQPYEQLAEVYRCEGDDASARCVLIAHQRRRRQQPQTSWPAKGWSWFLGGTVRYGYWLWLAGGWLIALAIVGSVIFGFVFDATQTPGGDLTPAKAVAHTPDFEPVLYAVDVLLPVISLGQDTGWTAHGAAQWFSAAGTLLGWLLTTAFIAGLIVRRG